MDGVQGFNPSSSVFQSMASKNLSQVGFGSIRTQKEVSQQEEQPSRHEVQDNVQLSMAGQMDETADAEEMTQNAAMSGALGEVLDDYDDDDQEIRERHNDNQEYNNSIGYGYYDENTNEVDDDFGINGLELNRLNDMDDDYKAAQNILKDIPSASLEPAQNIIANQIQEGRPVEALTNLKPVEGPNQIEYAAAESLGVLDIHDNNNKPMLVESDEDMGAAQKQNLAEDYINNAINSLPDDRKSMVNDMKEAVNAWAGAAGIDPKAAFAEKLRDLAAGWDYESLQAVAQTYVDANSELATSAAD